MVFLSQKVHGNMIFTVYRKVLVLIFLEIGNTVFPRAKRLIERWFNDYWKGLVLNFSGMENKVFFDQEVDGKMIVTGYWEDLVLNFLVMGNMVFFLAKKLMERWYLDGLFELSMIFEELGNMVFRTVHIVILLYTLLVIFLTWYKEYMVNISKFLDVLPVLLVQELFVIFEALVLELAF